MIVYDYVRAGQAATLMGRTAVKGWMRQSKVERVAFSLYFALTGPALVVGAVGQYGLEAVDL